MPRLIKNITTEFIEEKIFEIDGFNSVEGYVDLEDYVAVYNFTAYLQNFTNVKTSEELLDLKYYGLVSNGNKTFTEIDISY